METVEEWQTNKETCIQNLFSTSAVNYHNSPVIHNILSHKHRNDLSEKGNVSWLAERKANFLSNPHVIEIVSGIMAEMETKIISMERQGFDYFVLRFEWGPNGKSVPL